MCLVFVLLLHRQSLSDELDGGLGDPHDGAAPLFHGPGSLEGGAASSVAAPAPAPAGRRVQHFAKVDDGRAAREVDQVHLPRVAADVPLEALKVLAGLVTTAFRVHLAAKTDVADGVSLQTRHISSHEYMNK